MVINYTRATLAVAAACGSLLAAGCGSSSHNSNTSADSSSAGPAAAAYRFADCMRAHGVPKFPDPKVSAGPTSGSVKVAIMAVGNPRSPAIRMANKKCQGILPAPSSPSQIAAQQHTRDVDLVSFAQCLRAHGVTDFPDPTAQGQLTRQMITNAGVDLQAPQTLTAAKECIGASHGAITLADVEQAVNGP